MTETGKVHAATPWTRTALRNFAYAYPDALAQIEAAIPDGCYLVLIAAGSKPGRWGALLRDTTHVDSIARTTETYSTVGQACWAALAAARVEVAS